MTKASALILIIGMAAALLICSAPLAAARAADQPKYLLGTTLVLNSPAQLTAPPSGYWGDLLPIEYRFGMCYIVDAINAARQARSEKVMIDVTKYPINVGGETAVDGGWEYTMDFLGMQPADIDAALAKFPMSGPFAGLAHSYREVGNGYFNADTTGDSLTLDVLGHQIKLSTGESIGALRETIEAQLKAIFGNNAKFDISVSTYSSAFDGPGNFNVSVSVYLNGVQPQYGGEGG
jgi:hypothetical protein